MKKLIKPYKEESPLVTINKIRSLLNDIGILISEKYVQNGDFYVCRIEIINDGLVDYHIGTNGKGKSLEYAYASAYAEFMERLQNNLLINKSFFFSKYYNEDSAFNEQLKKDGKKIDFLFSPNEKILEIHEIVENNYKMLSDLLSIDNKDEIKNLIVETLNNKIAICTPFYNQKNNTTVYLPIEFLMQSTGSTGMCAGNSPEEALVQGLCEILERYAIIEIHTNKITPPTIPHEYFKEYPIYDLIKKIEKTGIEIIIKDFSLGKKLPVIGVVAINKNIRQYNVKAGADPWPLIALERCLTELYQSFSGIRLINKCDYGDFIEDRYSKMDRKEAEYINLMNVINNSTGQWPDSIFSDDSSYEFEGLNFNLGKNNKSDLNYLLQLIDNLGYQIYIRDVSFLGFNSYYIIVPGMSQDKKNKYEYTIFNKLNLLIGKINNISSLPKNELISLVSILEEKYIAIKENYINLNNEFLYNTDEDATDLTIDLLLSMANYKLGNVEKAYLYLKKYLKNKDVQDYLYFYACKDYLSLLKNGKNTHEIQSYMSKIYSTELANEVIKDLQDPNNIFQSYRLYSFFECKKCNVKKFKYYKIASILKNIEHKHKIHPIEQMNLSKIFY